MCSSLKFIIGDLTEEGYHRKMARLEAAALPSETVHGTTSSRQIAQDLSNPNLIPRQIFQLYDMVQGIVSRVIRCLPMYMLCIMATILFPSILN